MSMVGIKKSKLNGFLVFGSFMPSEFVGGKLRVPKYMHHTVYWIL